MRTIILNEFTKLKENEIDNGNMVFEYKSFGYDKRHAFEIATLEPFNLVRKNVYKNDDVIDGDIICHKDWFKYDKFLEQEWENDNDYPMEISWDHRFYIVVKSYDGNAYAVNINPQFYGDLVSEDKKIGFYPDGSIEQLVVPVEDLSDDYVFALSNSFIMKNFARCSSHVIDEAEGIVSLSDTDIYKINETSLIALRFIAFIKQLKNSGKDKIVVSFPGTKEYRDWFHLHLNMVKNHDDKTLEFKFLGSYKEGNNAVVICRPDVARKYLKSGYYCVDFADMVSGKYKLDKDPVRVKNKNN